MPRTRTRSLAVLSIAAALSLGIAGCTATPDESAATPSASESGVAVGGATLLPTCDEVTEALGGIQGDLAFNEVSSAEQTNPEAYDQRVCVYTTADTVTQLGVTIAAIPFQQSEIDGYAALPNAIADDRLEPYHAALQTFAIDDADDGHLDSALYLFDTSVSITIQALSVGGPPTSETLPALTVPAAVDAALAIRAFVR